MNCEQFRLSWVSDEPDERAAAERHAADCPACGKVVEADRALLARAQEWRDSSPAPSDLLERRISVAVAGELAGPAGGESQRSTRRLAQRGWVWAAAAALLVLVTLPIARSLLTDPNPYERDIRRADRARLEYTRAIADLEREARAKLDRSLDPDVSAEEAARLLDYRDRLAELDTVIADVESFLEQHPGHSGAHTVLLAACKEKQELLDELLQLPDGGTS